MSLPESFPSSFQNGLQFLRVPHEQPLKIVRGSGAEQDRDRFALAGNNDRTLLSGSYVLSKIGGDFVLSCNFHNSTSSPETKSRFPSFTPIAWIWTSRRSS